MLEPMTADELELLKMIGSDAPGESAGDYRGEDGLLMCGVCHQPKEVIVHVPEMRILGHVHKVVCGCIIAEQEREEERKRNEKKQRALDELLSISIVNERFHESTFDQFIETEHNSKALKIAKRYVEIFDDLYARNKGLLFFGEPSTGKTFLAACIANDLIKKKVPIMVTSIIKLVGNGSSFSDDLADTLSKLNQAKLVIIDDLGAERDTGFMAERVFEVIDSMYGSKKPMIFTTNLSIWQMKNETDIRRRRVYQRIFEVCHPVEFTGPSWRMKKAGGDFNELESLLAGSEEA